MEVCCVVTYIRQVPLLTTSKTQFELTIPRSMWLSVQKMNIRSIRSSIDGGGLLMFHKVNTMVNFVLVFGDTFSFSEYAKNVSATGTFFSMDYNSIS